ncbi:Hypothetical protein, putative [Bodo saltans]|uniref:Uncharacterized protein n=1 Tax=Bodo saltans TaxID=75058 RepID=A0A0S4IVW3_BODSA|nr:Hypothetical protein, putative [Bodo saltans]|eukprot:CUG05535.1 Hypothetical protein, putative [Bodo saltans]
MMHLLGSFSTMLSTEAQLLRNEEQSATLFLMSMRRVGQTSLVVDVSYNTSRRICHFLIAILRVVHEHHHFGQSVHLVEGRASCMDTPHQKEHHCGRRPTIAIVAQRCSNPLHVIIVHIKNLADHCDEFAIANGVSDAANPAVRLERSLKLVPTSHGTTGAVAAISQASDIIGSQGLMVSPLRLRTRMVAQPRRCAIT